MQNKIKSDSTDELLRKRNSSSGLENNPPYKMGKQNKSNNVRIRSAENILKDIKDLKQKRKENCGDVSNDECVSWLTETTFCPPTDQTIPQKNLEKFVRFLSNTSQNFETLQFWKAQYDEAASDEAVQIIDDSEKLALCPVCATELPKSEIEAHADECAAKMFKN